MLAESTRSLPLLPRQDGSQRRLLLHCHSPQGWELSQLPGPRTRPLAARVTLAL